VHDSKIDRRLAEMGHEHRIGAVRNIFALSPLATEERTFGIGSFVPQADKCGAPNGALFDDFVGEQLN
jgi:hypothetical protein